MKNLEIQEATASLAEYVREVAKGPVIVSRKGRPVAALVSIENTDWETASLSTNPRFLALIERSRKRHDMEGGISEEEMRRRLGLSSKDLIPRSSRRPQKRRRR
jgi:prevent-host-death family protein